MKKYSFGFILLIFICLHTNVFADIAPFSIEAKSINPGNKTSIRMESEKVVIDLYNDSSVVTCQFHMKNLGEHEKLRIGFPEMHFFHFRAIKESEKLERFKVKENGKEIRFYLSDSLKRDEEFRKKVDTYQNIHEWYLWDGEFEKEEAKTIEVQYTLPYGALYKSNQRFFTYLLSTGAGWEGTIGKAEIIVNLKDIEMDSIVSKHPANCQVTNSQLIWNFEDFEPTNEHDIKVYYKSNKNLYKGKVNSPPVFMVNGKIKEEFKPNEILANDIASLNVVKTSENNNGVVKIYTKDFVMNKLSALVKAKTKGKIILPEYDTLQEDYCLFVNNKEYELSKVIDIEKKNIAKLEIVNSNNGKNKIMIELKK
jgi:hypothetical protein